MAGVKNQRSGGHNAKTREQHEAEGTYRAHRHDGIENPEPPPGRPVPPKPLDGDAAEAWDRVCGFLEQSKILSVVDAEALYQYCQLFAEVEDIARIRSETGGSIQILEDNLAHIEADELVQVFQEITKLRAIESRCTTQVQAGRMKLRAYLVEFGLTPAARGRVKVASGKDDKPASPLAQIQGGARRSFQVIK
jgi:P27 family predicted phage terminase small subunit